MQTQAIAGTTHSAGDERIVVRSFDGYYWDGIWNDRKSIVLCDKTEQFTIFGQTWGTDLQVYSRGRCITHLVPVHIDSHDGAVAWAVRQIELGVAGLAVAS